MSTITQIAPTNSGFRFLLLLWTLFALGAWCCMSSFVSRARTKRRCPRHCAAGGTVIYDWEPDRNGIYDPPARTVLRCVFGDDAFDDVVAVEFGTPESRGVSDDELARLWKYFAALRGLRRIDFSTADVNPDAINQLRRIVTRLRGRTVRPIGLEKKKRRRKAAMWE